MLKLSKHVLLFEYDHWVSWVIQHIPLCPSVEGRCCTKISEWSVSQSLEIGGWKEGAADRQDNTMWKDGRTGEVVQAIDVLHIGHYTFVQVCHPFFQLLRSKRLATFKSNIWKRDEQHRVASRRQPWQPWITLVICCFSSFHPVRWSGPCFKVAEGGGPAERRVGKGLIGYSRLLSLLWIQTMARYGSTLAWYFWFLSKLRINAANVEYLKTNQRCHSLVQFWRCTCGKTLHARKKKQQAGDCCHVANPPLLTWRNIKPIYRSIT